MFYLAPDRQRAEVVSDTLIFQHDGAGQYQPVAFGTKAFVLPHALSLFCHRGVVPFLDAVWLELNRNYHGAGVDGLIGTIQPIARAAHADFAGHAVVNEIYLIGWSRRLSGFAAAYLASKNDFIPVDRAPGQAWFSGVGKELPPSAEAPSPGKWIRAAAALKSECGPFSCGGDLIMHELSTASGGTIRTSRLYRFEDYDTCLAAIEARWQTKSPSSSRSAISSLLPADC